MEIFFLSSGRNSCTLLTPVLQDAELLGQLPGGRAHPPPSAQSCISSTGEKGALSGPAAFSAPAGTRCQATQRPQALFLLPCTSVSPRTPSHLTEKQLMMRLEGFLNVKRTKQAQGTSIHKSNCNDEYSLVTRRVLPWAGEEEADLRTAAPVTVAVAASLPRRLTDLW